MWTRSGPSRERGEQRVRPEFASADCRRSGSRRALISKAAARIHFGPEAVSCAMSLLITYSQISASIQEPPFDMASGEFLPHPERRNGFFVVVAPLHKNARDVRQIRFRQRGCRLVLIGKDIREQRLINAVDPSGESVPHDELAEGCAKGRSMTTPACIHSASSGESLAGPLD